MRSWVRLQSVATTTRTSFALTAARHTLRLYRAEAGTRIDRILLTASPTFTPVADVYEAERATLVAPMRAATQIGIPTIGYVWVPNGAGAGGLVRFQTPSPASAKYAVWARVLAPTSADNAFVVSAELAAGQTWNVPVSSSWAWSRVGTPTTPMLLDLRYGRDSFVDFTRGDDGTKLDKIILTNDPGFAPADPVLASTSTLR